jgi:hypothetical protein
MKMRNSPQTHGMVLCATLMALLIVACAPSPMVKISPSKKPELVDPHPPTAKSPPSPKTGTPTNTLPAVKSVNGIQPDLVCAVPQEDYDIMTVVKTRLGVEAAARLTRLFSTDFKTADLTPQDRKLLQFIARETLWIPPFVERLIGDAYFNATKGSLTAIDVTDPVQEKQQIFATETLQKIVSVSPQTPFDIELMILKDGTPSGQAGGRLFVDQKTVRDAMGKDVARKDRLVFIYAHELAHIYKRHKAKRLQEQLISIDEAHKLVGVLMTQSSGWNSPESLIAAGVSLKAVVDGLLRHQADFLRSQEVEADACAASLMVQSKLGDPIKGFATYVNGRSAKKHAWTVYDEHPSDDQRRLVINYVAKSGQAKKPIPLEDVESNLNRHIRAAAKQDRDWSANKKLLP